MRIEVASCRDMDEKSDGEIQKFSQIPGLLSNPYFKSEHCSWLAEYEALSSAEINGTRENKCPNWCQESVKNSPSCYKLLDSSCSENLKGGEQ